ncbi:MAG: DUF6868 family protein [Planctomycetota bacterium]|jgi:hypothetical protein
MNDNHQQLEILARALIRCFLLSVALLAFWGICYLVIDDWAYGFHSRFFEMTRQQFDLIMYCGMGFVKLSAFVFFLIPYVALRLVLRAP